MNPVLILLAIIAMLPRAALASGFYLPWWGEALLFVLVTPAGWLCAALAVAALIVLIVPALRRGKDGR